MNRVEIMNRLFSHGCVLLLLSLLKSPTGISMQQTKSETTRTLAGVQLSPAATKLLDRVEKLYGIPVNAVENSNLPAFAHARCYVKYEGTPEIEIDPKIGMNEETIVHELMHLSLFAEGVPDLILLSGDPAVQGFITDVADQVEHAYFFPTMRELGIDPTVQGKADMHKFNEQNTVPKLYDLRGADLALNYFTDVAVLDDERLAMELERNEFWPGDNEARERGLAAVDLTKRNFATPDEELRVFIAICNVFLEGKYHLCLVSVDDHQRGKVTMKDANIEVEKTVLPIGR
jgi:hypothetical protein